MAPVDQRLHLPVEEGQQQGADVLAVDVGVGHDDELVVAELLDVEAVLALPMPVPMAAMRVRTSSLERILSSRAFLDVEDLALERQDRLETPVAALLGRAAGGVALDDEELGVARGSRSWQSASLPGRGDVQHALAAREVLGLAGGLAGLGRGHGLGADGFGRRRGSPRRRSPARRRRWT